MGTDVDETESEGRDKIPMGQFENMRQSVRDHGSQRLCTVDEVCQDMWQVRYIAG